ncbi:MAG: division/cell wall cluster transcriptional repressor MraZ [Negativicutes bacterium]
MFFGEYEHSIDVKGRLILPARIREKLGEKCFVTRGLDSCLNVFTEVEWENFVAKFRNLPMGREDARKAQRFFVGGAAELECDKMGRVQLPTNLREYALLEKDVVVIGNIDHVEIWSKPVWQNYNNEDGTSINEIAEKLVDLGF